MTGTDPDLELTGRPDGSGTGVTEAPAQRDARSLWSLLPWLPVLLLLALWIWVVPHSGRLQYNDYYGLIEPLWAGDRFSLDPRVYVRLKSNEHTIALPAMLYAANAELTAGDNRYLSALALLFMVGGFVMLCRWLPAELRADPLSRAIAVATLAAFALPPMAAHNVVRGFSGTIWCFANLWSIAAMSVLLHRAGSAAPWRLWPVVVLGAAGALTYSTSMSLWPALLLGAVLLGASRGQLSTLAVSAVGVVSLFARGVHTPSYHPAPILNRPVLLLKYLCTYLGVVLVDHRRPAMLLGLAGLLLLGGLVVGALVRWRECRSLAPWLMLVTYGFGNGLGTAVARAGFGLEQALASRYATLSGFFWIGALGGLWQLVSERWPARTTPRKVVAGLSVVLAGVSLVFGLVRLRTFVEVAGQQPAAEMALVHDIHDEDVLRILSPAPMSIIKVRPFLRATKHVPFDRPAVTPYGETIPSTRLAASCAPGVHGEFEGVTPLGGLLGRVGGWVVAEDRRVERIFLLDRDEVVRGEAFRGFRRPDLDRSLGPDRRCAGWLGYALTASASSALVAYVQLEGEELLCPLPGEHGIAP